MQTNKISYVCFFVVCCMVSLDIYLSSNIALQMVCILLCVVCVGLGIYIAFKQAKGCYYTNEQAHNLQSYLSENIALNAQIKALGADVQKAKKLALSSPELQNTILQNRRLTAQIANLQVRITQQAEQINELKIKLKTAQSTPILAMPVEQQTNLKKSKTA